VLASSPFPIAYTLDDLPPSQDHKSILNRGVTLPLPAPLEGQAFDQSPASLLHPSLQDTPRQLYYVPIMARDLGPPSTSRPTRAAAKKTKARPKLDNIVLEDGVDFVEFDPKRRLTCHICHKGFPKPYDLTRHIRSHTGEKPFVCDVGGCGKGFVQVGFISSWTLWFLITLRIEIRIGGPPTCAYGGTTIQMRIPWVH
jgi:uncharacterized Zn-finger protein